MDVSIHSWCSVCFPSDMDKHRCYLSGVVFFKPFVYLMAIFLGFYLFLYLGWKHKNIERNCSFCLHLPLLGDRALFQSGNITINVAGLEHSKLESLWDPESGAISWSFLRLYPALTATQAHIQLTREISCQQGDQNPGGTISSLICHQPSKSLLITLSISKEALLSPF